MLFELYVNSLRAETLNFFHCTDLSYHSVRHREIVHVSIFLSCYHPHSQNNA